MATLVLLLLLAVGTLGAQQALYAKHRDGLAMISMQDLAAQEGDYLVAATEAAGTFLFRINVTSNPVVIPLMNIRQPVVFKYYRAEAESVLAQSNEITFDDSEPLQGHLALTTNANEMAITWVSNSTAKASVRWGTTRGSFSNSAPATNLTYTIKDMCAAPANQTSHFLDPGTIYTGKMSNLPFGQEIFYSYGSEQYGWSKTFSFHVVAPGTKTMNFIAFGDLGVDPDQQPAMLSTERMREHLNETDLVVHIGDISYARGHAYIWESFFNQIEPIATRVPYMTSIGNHEYDYIGQPFHPVWATYGSDSGGECGVPYTARLPMPTGAGTGLHNRVVYYAFNYGPVHIAMMDSESDYLPNSPQYKWLEEDLAAVDRGATPFVVVTNHRPLYDSSWGGLLPEVAEVRRAVEPLLETFAVDLVLVGHVHVYQRSCRVLNNTCDRRGPVHMTIGMAGNIVQTPWLDAPAWLEKRSLHHGIALFSVANSTAMKVQFQQDITGAIEDEFWLYR